MEKRVFIYVTLAVGVWAVLGTIVAGYYFVQYNTYRNEYTNLATQLDMISLEANLLINYGNETKTWYNNTVLPLGSSAFAALNLTVDKVDYEDYGEWGIFVISINGVANQGSSGWFYCYWNYERFEWVFPDYSSGKYIVHDGDTIAFTFDVYPAKPPT